MGSVELIIAGVIAALIWLGCCALIEGRNRKYVILTGVIIDVVLFAICRNYILLLCGLAGGLLCGLGVGAKSRKKYETAIREFRGVRNWIVASMILFVMIFMCIAIACPDMEIVFG